MKSQLALLTLLAASLATAQDPFAAYKCDVTLCKLPACRCATKGRPVDNPPQFVILTHDDAIQAEVMGPVNAFLKGRLNPNGCPIGSTFFTQAYYSDPILATNYYGMNQEVATHSIDHLDPNPTATFQGQVQGSIAFAVKLGGVPATKVIGFRHPFLSYTAESLAIVASSGLKYDSSMSSYIDDDVWPYTLDYGTVNDCNAGVKSLCGKTLNAKGLWEIPLASVMTAAGVALGLDVYNYIENGQTITPANIVKYYKEGFDRRYKGDRTPFGIYTHPVWLGPANQAIPDGSGKLAALLEVLDYAMQTPDVWVITNSQLIEYMKNPVSATDLPSQYYMQCNLPAPPTNICNGLDMTLAETCNLATATIHTCYGCPASLQSITNIIPVITTTRCPPPATCDTKYWDPVGCKCLCTTAICAPGSTVAIPVQAGSVYIRNSPSGTTTGANGNNNNSTAPDAKKNSSLSLNSKSSIGIAVILVVVAFIQLF